MGWGWLVEKEFCGNGRRQMKLNTTRNERTKWYDSTVQFHLNETHFMVIRCLCLYYIATIFYYFTFFPFRIFFHFLKRKKAKKKEESREKKIEKNNGYAHTQNIQPNAMTVMCFMIRCLFHSVLRSHFSLCSPLLMRQRNSILFFSLPLFARIFFYFSLSAEEE